MIGEATAPIDLGRISDEYRAWNHILIEELFPPGQPGTPVYLAVHDGLLSELGARHHRGTRDNFVSDVRTLIRAGRPYFVELAFLEEIWREKKHKEPPFVAGLALAVLAVGDVVTDERSYYARLNSLLGVGGRERPEDFGQTVDMWKSLRDWLRMQRRGELVLRGLEGRGAAIDIVKAQCLIRGADLPQLATALRSYSNASLDLDPDLILPALARFLAGSGAQSRLARLIGSEPDPAVLRQAADAVCAALESWQPTQHQPRAVADTSAARATLAVRPNPFPSRMWKRAEWLLRIPAAPTAEEAECMVQVGDDVRITKLDVREPASYDLQLGKDDVVRIIRDGLRVSDDQGNDITPRVDFPMWFQDGAERGRPGSWNIVMCPGAGVRHVLVCATATELQAQLRSATESTELTGVDDWPGVPLLGAHSVVFASGASLPGDLKVHEQLPRLRVAGGLLLRRGVYLRGALPSVVADPGIARVVPLTGPSGPVSISTDEFASLDLPEGAYSVTIESATEDIFVAEPRWHECIAPDGIELDRSVTNSIDGGDLRGAVLNVSVPRYVAHVVPGKTFRLYTSTAMEKGEVRPNDGIQELVRKSPIKDIVVLRSVRPSGPLPHADCFDETDDEAMAPPPSEGLDRLLEFISARGEGGVQTVRTYCAACLGDQPWHAALTTLEDLGHVDVNWETGRWFSAPPVFVPRAADPELAVLTGSRARDTLPTLTALGVAARSSERARDPGRPLAPQCLVARVRDLEQATLALPRQGVHLLHVPAAVTLAEHCKDVVDASWWLGAEFSPSPRVRPTLEQWDPEMLRWFRYPEDAELDGPALYRWREQGLPIHYLWTPTVRGKVRDFAAAKWRLAPRDRSFVVYDGHEKSLWVPLAMGLPRAIRRACTLSTGLMPVRYGRALIYEGIPLSFARTVAVRLNQTRAEGLW